MAIAQRTCSVEGCNGPHQGRGYCRKHYLRFYKHGDPSVTLNPIGQRPATCSVAGCHQPHCAHGYCGKHAYRYRRYGDPLGGGPSRASRGEPAKWIHAHVSHDGPGCLIWPHGQTAYSLLWVNGESVSAHRYMCSLANGAPPSPGMVAAHSCGGGAAGCVHPKHLRWATAAENEADKLKHGTRLLGEAVNFAKLTATQVREIRALRGKASQWDIARRYGVTQGAISCIFLGKTWAHLD